MSNPIPPSGRSSGKRDTSAMSQSVKVKFSGGGKSRAFSTRASPSAMRVAAFGDRHLPDSSLIPGGATFSMEGIRSAKLLTKASTKGTDFFRGNAGSFGRLMNGVRTAL